MDNEKNKFQLHRQVHKGDLLTSKKKLKGRKRFMKKNEQYTFTGIQPLQMYDQLTLVSNVYLPVVTMMVDDMADKCGDRDLVPSGGFRTEADMRFEVMREYIAKSRATLTAVYTLLDSKIAAGADTAAS